MVSASQRRVAVRHLQSRFNVSQRRVCLLLRLSRTACRYTPKRDEQLALRKRIVELARSRVRYGYKRIHVLLKREGIDVNKKRVHRLYCLEGLQIGKKRKRRHVSSSARAVHERLSATKPNESWAMDFVSEQLQCGHRIRILAIIDTYSRECLCLHVGNSLGAVEVVECLNRIAYKKGFPKRVYCDNGSEFAGRLVDLWAYQNNVKLVFSRPGKPTDNAFVESFNGSLRDECLNCHWFSSLNDAKLKLQAWAKDYNESRPHKALNYQSPMEYLAKHENLSTGFS